MHPKSSDGMKREALLERIKEEQNAYFHQEVLKFFNDNKAFIVEQITDEINYVVEVVDCEIEFIALWIETESVSELEFNVAVSVDLHVIASYGKNDHHERLVLTDIWVLVHCSCDVKDGLKDFKIHYIEDYEKYMD